MTDHRRGSWTLATSLVVATVAGCFAPPAPCKSNLDCGSSGTCVNGGCIPAGQPVPPDLPEEIDPVLAGIDPEWQVDEAMKVRVLRPTLRLTQSGSPVIAFLMHAGEPWTGSFYRPAVGRRAGASWEIVDLGVHDLLRTQFELLRGGDENSFALGTGGSFYFTERVGNDFDRYRIFEGSPSGYGRRFDVVLDAAGVLHGLALDEGVLHYFSWDGDRSQINVVTEELAVLCPGMPLVCEAEFRLWVDAAGEPHAAFKSDMAVTVTLASRAQGQWSFEQLPPEVKPGVITQSDQDEPTFCFAEEGALVGSATIRCMRLRAGTWEPLNLLVNEKGVRAEVLDAREEPDGTQRVLYSELRTGSGEDIEERLVLARWDGAAWHRTTVYAIPGTWTTGGAVPSLGAAMQVEPGGKMHVTVALGDRLLYLTSQP